MHINEAGISLIKSFEGCSLKSYKCPAQVITIGYGHTGTFNGKPLTMGITITQQQANELLKQDLVKYENYVHSLKRDKEAHPEKYERKEGQIDTSDVFGPGW